MDRKRKADAMHDADEHENDDQDIKTEQEEPIVKTPCIDDGKEQDNSPFSTDLLQFGTECWHGEKETNEDRAILMLHAFLGPVCGVLDGHGGTFTVEFLVRQLVKSMQASIKHHLGAHQEQMLVNTTHNYQQEAARLQELEKQHQIFEAQRRYIHELLQQDAQDADLMTLCGQLTTAMNELDAVMKQTTKEQDQRLSTLRSALSEENPVIRRAITEAFRHIDDQILKKNPSEDGSTACLLWFSTALLTAQELSLYAINLGDSRAVLCRNGKAVPLTVDHKPDRPSERTRILKAGGFVSQLAGVARVYSAAGAGLSADSGSGAVYLAVSRAFGDRSLKHPSAVVSAEPEINHYKIEYASDLLIVLACDGIWNVLSNQEAIDLALRHFENPQDGAKAIVNEAYRRQSRDNLTATAITFAWQTAKAKELVNNQIEKPQTAEEVEELDMFNL